MFSSFPVHLFLRWITDLEVYLLDELSSLLACYLVSVRIGLKRSGIDDCLVVHQLVTLVVGKGVEIVSFGVSDDLVGFDHLCLAGCWISSKTFWCMTS